MSDLQMMIAGAIWGALLKASGEDGPFAIDVGSISMGDDRLPEVLVTGRESGQKVRIRIEDV